MGERIDATIRLRRDNDFNFDLIKDSFIPMNGEVILVDTAYDGLRAKVGDGYSTYAQLQYVDQDIRNAVLQGYYYKNGFYKDVNHQIPFKNMINKVYIDKPHRKFYYFNGEQYVTINVNLPTASSATAGAVKLYTTTGYNTDGTMTQKAITDELDLRFKTNVDEDNELLVFTL